MNFFGGGKCEVLTSPKFRKIKEDERCLLTDIIIMYLKIEL